MKKRRKISPKKKPKTSPRMWLAGAAIFVAVFAVQHIGRFHFGKAKFSRSLASVVPGSMIQELEEQVLKRLLRREMNQAQEALLRKEVRSTLLDEFSRIDGAYRNWDELVERYAYKDRSMQEMLESLGKFNATKVLSKLNAGSAEAIENTIKAFSRRLDDSIVTKGIKAPDLSKLASRTAVAGPKFSHDFHTAIGAGSNVFVFEGKVLDAVSFKLGGKAEFARFQDFLERTQLIGHDLYIRFDAATKKFIFRSTQEQDAFVSWLKKFKDPLTDIKLNSAFELENEEDIFKIIELYSQTNNKSKISATIYNADHLVPGGGIDATKSEQGRILRRIEEWATSREMEKTTLSLVTPHKGRLKFSNPSIATIKVDLPDQEERLRLILKKMENDPFIKHNLDSSITPQKLASATSGLNFNVLDYVLNRISKEGLLVDLPRITKIKQEFIMNAFNGKLVMRAPTHDFEVARGALTPAAAEEIDNIFGAIEIGDLQAVPTGIFIGGHQNTGKTFLAEGMAASSGFTVFEFKDLLDKYIGESEKLLADIFDTAKSMDKVGFWIDEADKFFGLAQDNINEVSDRILAMFLLEMSDNRNQGKLLFMLGSARLENMKKSADLWRRLEGSRIVTRVPRSLDEKRTAFANVLKELSRGEYGKYFAGVSINDFDDAFLQKLPLMPIGEIRNVFIKARRAKPGQILDPKLVREKFEGHTPTFREADINRSEAMLSIDCGTHNFSDETISKLAPIRDAILGERSGREAALGTCTVAPAKGL